jgi:hypothetical protein
MARFRRGKKHRSGKKKLPLTIAVPAAVQAYKIWKVRDNMDYVAYEALGIHYSTHKMDYGKAVEIVTPYVAGVLLHKFVGPTINRYIPKWCPVNF